MNQPANRVSKFSDIWYRVAEVVVATPLDYVINHYKSIGIAFAACAAGFVGNSIYQKHDGLSSLEIQLRAQGQSEAVAKCFADATSRRNPWTSTVLIRDVSDTMIKKGHELVSSGTVNECKPK